MTYKEYSIPNVVILIICIVLYNYILKSATYRV